MYLHHKCKINNRWRLRIGLLLACLVWLKHTLMWSPSSGSNEHAWTLAPEPWCIKPLWKGGSQLSSRWTKPSVQMSSDFFYFFLCPLVRVIFEAQRELQMNQGIRKTKQNMFTFLLQSRPKVLKYRCERTLSGHMISLMCSWSELTHLLHKTHLPSYCLNTL